MQKRETKIMGVLSTGVSAVYLLLNVTACSSGEPRQEVIDKLRSLGVAANPLVSVPSSASIGSGLQTVELTIYAALPSGMTVTTTPYKDSVAGNGIQLSTSDIQMETGTDQYKELNGLRLYSVKAKVNVPTLAAVQKISSTGVQVQYGFTLSDGTNAENMIGTFMTYPAGSSQLSWQAPSASISSPADGATIATGKSLDLNGNASTPNGEGLTIGWFVTKGEVSNRRAALTSWSVTEAGAQTLIMTVHGATSRGFAITTSKVTTQ